ncbi:Phospholipid phosphatase-related protein type 5 [Bagarius yarrelli]|uniref:Phospholipid phosphatase-related protein type 5 n=1 Tax=Bagarius yarrelli TaxID=175774 RepID=A0A556TQ76_BAGYA|nr:Phospholipid phosphatase-related protein type 5 [Bagarius yarrelli]
MCCLITRTNSSRLQVTECMNAHARCRTHVTIRRHPPLSASEPHTRHRLVIMAGTVMLAYYFEYTDTFNVHVQGFFCYDNAYTKPYLGPEEASAIPPALLYALVAGVPTLVITVTEAVLFLMQYTSKDPESRKKTIVTGDCCYLNPLVRRTCRFLGVYMFGLFTTDIFVNAGQVVTGNLAPHFLTVCKPNYTALGCQQALRYISHQEACTGNGEDILRARKTFPSKEAALSTYAALYLAMYITCSVKAKGTRLAKPVMSLGLMCLAFLTGINRVAEYRNHWSDVIAGFIIGVAIATFLVVCVVHNFKGGQMLSEDPQEEEKMGSPRVESPLEKYIASQMAELRAEEEALTPRSLKARLLSFFDWITGKRSRFNHLQNTRQ